MKIDPNHLADEFEASIGDDISPMVTDEETEVVVAALRAFASRGDVSREFPWRAVGWVRRDGDRVMHAFEQDRLPGGERMLYIATDGRDNSRDAHG